MCHDKKSDATDHCEGSAKLIIDFVRSSFRVNQTEEEPFPINYQETERKLIERRKSISSSEQPLTKEEEREFTKNIIDKWTTFRVQSPSEAKNRKENLPPNSRLWSYWYCRWSSFKTGTDISGGDCDHQMGH